jgi:hypothetical protein
VDQRGSQVSGITKLTHVPKAQSDNTTEVGGGGDAGVRLWVRSSQKENKAHKVPQWSKIAQCWTEEKNGLCAGTVVVLE